MKLRFLGILLSLTMVFASFGTPLVCYADESGEITVDSTEETQTNVVTMLEETTPVDMSEPQPEDVPVENTPVDEQLDENQVENHPDDEDKLDEIPDADVTLENVIDAQDETPDELAEEELADDLDAESEEKTDKEAIEGAEKATKESVNEQLGMLITMTTSDEILSADLEVYAEALAAVDAAKAELEAERKEIVDFEMPEIQTGEHPFNYIVDPDQVITATNAVRYNGASFEPNQTMYFENGVIDETETVADIKTNEAADDATDVVLEENTTEAVLTTVPTTYMYSHISDSVDIADESTVPVKITVQLNVSDMGVDFVQDKANLQSDPNATMYFAIVDSEGNEYPVDEDGIVSVEQTIEPEFETDDEGNEVVTPQLFSFSLTGACNASEGWANVSVCPEVLVSWTVEPQLEDEDVRAARLLAKEQALEQAQLALEEARTRLATDRDSATTIDAALKELIDKTINDEKTVTTDELADANEKLEDLEGNTESAIEASDNDANTVIENTKTSVVDVQQDENLAENTETTDSTESTESSLDSQTVTEPVVDATPAPVEETPVEVITTEI